MRLPSSQKASFCSHDFISFAEISMKMYYHVVFYIVIPVASDVVRHVVFISNKFLTITNCKKCKKLLRVDIKRISKLLLTLNLDFSDRFPDTP